jgi:hypothetical protein
MPIQIKPQIEALQEFTNFTKKVLKNNNQITPTDFFNDYINIQRSCLPSLKRDMFCHEADKFVTELEEKNHHDFAGIVISSLCKLTDLIPDLHEYFAIKGYKLAKANGDVLHSMARLNELRKIYYKRPERLKDYLNVMYAQENCLKKLAYDYNSAISTYHSITRPPAKQEEYKTMLAYVQTELAKITKRKHPHQAIKKLNNAREIFLGKGNQKSVEYIDMLLNEIQIQLKNSNL